MSTTLAGWLGGWQAGVVPRMWHRSVPAWQGASARSTSGEVSTHPPTTPQRPPFADGKWFNFKGRPGGTYNLYTDGGGARLDCTFGAGGFGGKATFVRAIKFTRGTDRVTAVLAKAGKQWVLTGGWAHVQYRCSRWQPAEGWRGSLAAGAAARACMAHSDARLS